MRKWEAQCLPVQTCDALKSRPREMPTVQLLFRLRRNSTPRSIRERVEFLKLACLHLGLRTAYYRAT